jgi:hypothetical protein
MSPKYQHYIRGRGAKFENLRSLVIFFQDCSIRPICISVWKPGCENNSLQYHRFLCHGMTCTRTTSKVIFLQLPQILRSCNKLKFVIYLLNLSACIYLLSYWIYHSKLVISKLVICNININYTNQLLISCFPFFLFICSFKLCNHHFVNIYIYHRFRQIR